MNIVGTHNVTLVLLSVLIAIAASFTALDLASRVRASTGSTRHAWLATAALAMGGGIWAMHFVGMLAFSMPGMEVTYDVGLTAVSLFVPIVVTGISFMVISREQPRPPVLLASGLFMGLGIVAMHYMGMAAMEMPADLRYDRLWVAVSVLIAIGASTVALWLSLRTSRVLLKIVAAVAMGLAVSGMHYAAMQGASFKAGPAMAMAQGRASLGQATLAIAVAASTFLILFLALLAAMFDRRFALLAAREARALRQSEERFRSLYTKTPLPLHSLDGEGRIEHVSDAWLAMTGYRRDEVLGRPMVSFLAADSARQASETDWPSLLQSGQLKDAEYRVLTKAGETLDVIASAQVEKDPDDRFLRVLGGLTDVTAYRRAEDALRQAQKMEAVGQLTGGVAHDFNNLLTVIRSSIDLLKRPNLAEERRRRYIDVISDTTERGAKLTGQLLAFARRQALKPETFDAVRRVATIGGMVKSLTGSRIVFQTDLVDEPCFVNADPTQFDTSVINLAVNARDAMDGQGHLAVVVRPASIIPARRAHPAATGDFVCVSVSDTGCGIAPGYLGKIFEPFFTTKEVGKGTGLGLSQVIGFAKQSGGDIAVESELDRGTTFTLYLPRSGPPEIEAVLTDGAALLVHGHGTCVLVVEDNLEVGSFATLSLEELGYESVLVTDAVAALGELAKDVDRFDVVFSDVIMPGMSGIELGQEIRRLHPSLPVVLTSGYSHVLAENGAHGFELLHKPYSIEELSRVLHKAAVWRRRKRALAQF